MNVTNPVVILTLHYAFRSLQSIGRARKQLGMTLLTKKMQCEKRDTLNVASEILLGTSCKTKVLDTEKPCFDT